jgi:hypothetical protein
MTENFIVLFKDGDILLDVPVSSDRDTLWLTANQMAVLFDKDDKTIRKHINNVFTDDELDEEVVVANFATTSQHGAVVGKTQTCMTQFYNLDVIISVGYRVKSKRGIAFRRWANSVLKEYLLKGYAVNKQRLNQLDQVISIISRSDNPEIAGVSTVLERFVRGLDILDRYDHQSLKKPQSKEHQKADEDWKLFVDGNKRIAALKKRIRCAF